MQSMMNTGENDDLPFEFGNLYLKSNPQITIPASFQKAKAASLEAAFLLLIQNSKSEGVNVACSRVLYVAHNEELGVESVFRGY